MLVIKIFIDFYEIGIYKQKKAVIDKKGSPQGVLQRQNFEEKRLANKCYLLFFVDKSLTN